MTTDSLLAPSVPYHQSRQGKRLLGVRVLRGCLDGSDLWCLAPAFNTPGSIITKPLVKTDILSVTLIKLELKLLPIRKSW